MTQRSRTLCVTLNWAWRAHVLATSLTQSTDRQTDRQSHAQLYSNEMLHTAAKCVRSHSETYWSQSVQTATSMQVDALHSAQWRVTPTILALNLVSHTIMVQHDIPLWLVGWLVGAKLFLSCIFREPKGFHSHLYWHICMCVHCSAQCTLSIYSAKQSLCFIEYICCLHSAMLCACAYMYAR